MNILTKEEIINKLQEKQIKDAYVIAYFYNKVCVGLFKEIDSNDYFDEEMFVTGNQILNSDENFTTVTQLNRIVDIPLKVTDEEVKKGIRLVVRNYFDTTEYEQVILGKSRLVEFKKEAK